MKVINIDKEIMGEQQFFYGTRVPIKSLFDYLETGESIQEFLNDFPSVQKEQFLRLLELSQKMITSSSEILSENIVE